MMSAGRLRLIPVGDGQVILKRGVRELMLSGEDARQVVEPLLDALEDGVGVADALAALPAERHGAAVDVLRALAMRDMLSDGESPTGDTPDTVFYANFGPAGRSSRDAIAGAHVIVHGIGAISRSVAEGLSAVGVGRVTVVDEPALRGHEADSVGAFDLRRISVADADGAPVDADLLVATSDAGQEAALLAVAQRALDRGARFLPAWLSDLTGYVGPLTHPFQTACLRCYQLRVDSNDPHRDARRALRRRVVEDPSVGAASGFLAPMAAVVGQIAAMEVAKELGGFAPVDAVARSIEINLVSFRSTVRRVLKLPRCPDCGEPVRRAPRTIFGGIQVAQ